MKLVVGLVCMCDISCFDVLIISMLHVGAFLLLNLDHLVMCQGGFCVRSGPVNQDV